MAHDPTGMRAGASTDVGPPVRLAGLDGLRGIAVLLVVLSHIGWPGFGPTGSTGVTVFFTLSGFLITALLLEEHDRKGRIDLGAFWVRRGLRLFPALWLFVILAGVVAVGVGIMTILGFLRTAAAPLFYIANFVDPQTLGPFRHTWSLAVEEQFYLIWPGLMIIAARIPRRRLPIVLAIATVLACWWRLHQGLAPVDYGSKLVYEAMIHRTDTCAFSLLAGATLSAALRAGLRLPRLNDIASDVVCASLVVVPLALGGLVGLSGVTGPVFATACALALIVAAAGRRAGMLQTSSLRALGRISYGWYLWHYLGVWLVHHFSSYRDAPLAWGLAVAVSSLLLAAVSWRIVERPILRLKRRFERSSIAAVVPN